MSVAVVFKDTGTTCAILPRDSAEEMVDNNPDVYAIRETDEVDLLLKAVATIGDPILTQALVHQHQHQDELRRTPEQKAVHKEQKKKARKPESETPIESVSGEKVEAEAPIVEVEAPKPKPDAKKKRDRSPERHAIRGVDRIFDVYQRTFDGLFRVRTSLNHDFQKMLGTVGIDWPSHDEKEMQANGRGFFVCKTKKMAQAVEETLKGLGCVRVKYIPWTEQELRDFPPVKSVT